MKKNKIPKIIHYCWFGGSKKPELVEKCIASWKKFCPDYEIREWNEKNFDINIHPYVAEAYAQKKWAFVADYARLWIINKCGGVYLDTDVELIKPLDELLCDEAFFCMSDPDRINTGIGFGSVKHHLGMERMLEQYSGAHFMSASGEMDLTPCPVRNSDAITKLVGERWINLTNKTKIGGICIYPPEYFSPLDYYTHELHTTDLTVGIHWYGESWLPHSEQRRNIVKRRVTRMIGKKNFFRLRRILRGY